MAYAIVIMFIAICVAMIATSIAQIFSDHRNRKRR